MSETQPSARTGFVAPRALLRRGYRGIFIDDVNMLLRVADGSGHEVAPVDPRTGSAMSLTAWRAYVARFAIEIRAAFPRAELVHNVLWFAGDSDPAIRRQLAAADLVNIEGGVDDPGIHGGGGQYGFETLLEFIDHRHQQSGAVVLGGGRDYALATYLIVNWGHDAISSDFGSQPGDWWSGWQTALGAPRGARRQWHGLLRRDFPAWRCARQPARFRQTRTVRIADRSVTLEPASGTVLRTSGSAR
jgi:hypothetical protein